MGRPLPALLSVLIGLGLLLLALFDLAVTTPGWPYVVFLGVPALAVGSFTLRRTPEAVLVVSAIALSGTGSVLLACVDYRYVGSWGFAESVTLLLLLAVRVRRAVRPSDWLLVGAVVAALLAQSLRLAIQQAPLLAEMFTIAAAAAAVVGIALRSADGQHRRAVAEVRRAERIEMARELHDVVAHHVTGMVVATQAARAVESATPGTMPPAVSQALLSVETAGTDALTSMRRMVEVLRAAPGDTLDGPPVAGAPELQELVDRFRSSDVVEEVDLMLDPHCSTLPAVVQAAIYRVVRESLTNIQRHSPKATHAAINVQCSATNVHIQVKNSHVPGHLPGRPPLVGGGFGLPGMRERVIALGGELVAGPEEDGWAVRAVIPVTDVNCAQGRPA